MRTKRVVRAVAYHCRKTILPQRLNDLFFLLGLYPSENSIFMDFFQKIGGGPRFKFGSSRDSVGIIHAGRGGDGPDRSGIISRDDPDDHAPILEKSYRLPHPLAEIVIKRINGYDRQCD